MAAFIGRQEGVQHGDVDVLAAAGLFGHSQSRENADRAVQRRVGVRDRKIQVLDRCGVGRR